jgi:hypothetical protein
MLANSSMASEMDPLLFFVARPNLFKYSGETSETDDAWMRSDVKRAPQYYLSTFQIKE